MRRALIQFVLPHEETHARAHSLSHQALFLYATFILLIQLFLNFVSFKFPGILGFASDIRTEEIISETNHFRESNNLPALKVNEKLARAAQLKAAYMFEKDFWAHVAPDGTTPWKFILDSDYRYLYAGENLAKDFQSSTDVVSAWEASKAGHRENLLGSNYTDIGVAVVDGVLGGFETTLVVQMFGSVRVPATAVAAAPPAPAPQKATTPTSPAPTPITAVEKIVGPSELVLAPGVKPSVSPPLLTPEEGKPLIPIVDVISLVKSISFAFGFFLLILFILDGLIIFRRGAVRISGHNGGHILVLLLIIGSTFFFSTGSIR